MDKNKLRKFLNDVEINKALIVNYSHGHRNSSLLLFPYSHLVNFVNNNVDKSKVNAILQWSSNRHQLYNVLGKQTVHTILEREHGGLMLEMVEQALISRKARISLLTTCLSIV